MTEKDKTVHTSRAPIPGSELSMPAPPPEAHWTVYKITGPDGKVYIGQTGQPLTVRRDGSCLSSQREAVRITGITNIHAACTRVARYAGGYHWRFVNREENSASGQEEQGDS